VNPTRQEKCGGVSWDTVEQKKECKKDLLSDAAILFGAEKHDKRFKDSNQHFQQVKDKYKDFQLDTTGHSLGGQLAKYVTDNNLDKVNTNVNFSRGSGSVRTFSKEKQQIH
jgi:putative lipase involved disintegration of autophagic bodies